MVSTSSNFLKNFNNIVMKCHLIEDKQRKVKKKSFLDKIIQQLMSLSLTSLLS